MRDDLTDSQIDELAHRWAAWSRTRRFFAPSIPKNVLAQMQPGRVRPVPDPELSAELALFNTAIAAQGDSPAKISFLIHYLALSRCTKEAAAAQGITRDAFYRRVRRFRRRAYRSMQALEAANDEGAGYVRDDGKVRP
ncbi:hypothetical protein VSR34_09680 [Paraburkholderia sp. JHI2823]|uniref:hypothetical protein n=1 Tax=Paraburkholderia sp. JHI2823 TaxID=3112960 RepID=UPI00318118D1